MMTLEDLFHWLLKAAQHPAAYGFASGVARFVVGDRTAGWKSFVTTCLLAVFVALGSMLYLADEPYTASKKAFFVLIASFLARDLLIALVSIGAHIRTDPMGFFQRVLAALKGAPKGEAK